MGSLASKKKKITLAPMLTLIHINVHLIIAEVPIVEFSPTAVSDQLMSGADGVDADHGDSQLDFNTPVVYSPETNYDSSIISSNSPPIMDNTLPVNDSPAIDDISIKPDLSIAIDEAPMTDVNG